MTRLKGRRAALALGCGLLISCLLISCVLAAAPAAAEPLRLDAFFTGRLTGTGTVDNRKDGTHRAYTAVIVGAWNGPRGTVTEDLTYADGETRRFAWTFERIGEGRFIGHRDDLSGDAIVTQDGEAVRMVYTAKTRLPSGSVWTLSFDDRFERDGPGRVTLRGDVSYLFVTVGRTTMTINKSQP